MGQFQRQLYQHVDVTNDLDEIDQNEDEYAEDYVFEKSIQMKKPTTQINRQNSECKPNAFRFPMLRFECKAGNFHLNADYFKPKNTWKIFCFK